jgi:3-oxoacyl-[acyl-carrier-protein] synthase-3
MTSVGTIDRVHAYAPPPEVGIEDLAKRLRLKPFQVRMFKRVHGLARLRIDPDLPLIDLVVHPAREVLEGVDPESVRYLLYAHTIQEVTPSTVDAAEELRRSLGLSWANAFAVTQQNCASGLAAIDIALELLRADADRDAVALVVTGEKAFSYMAQLIPGTTVMGEGAGACLVRIDERGDKVLSYVSRTLGQYAAGVRLDPVALHEFSERYTSTLVAVLLEALRVAGIELEDLDRIIPHNVNRSSWLRVTRELDIDRDLVYLDNVPRLGHCYCSDFFLNYAAMRDVGEIVPGGTYLVAAVGLGATFAAMVIQHGTDTAS